MKIIDIHTHGIGGYDTREATEEHILKIAEIQGNHGISDILLAIYPAPIQQMRREMETVRRAMATQHSPACKNQSVPHSKRAEQTDAHTGTLSTVRRPAAIAGVHLEGPFLNPAQCGSLNAEACVNPTVYLWKNLTEGFEGLIKIITVAPEIPGVLNLIRTAADMGIVVSMGHSDATYGEAEEGFRAGAKGVTHIFNAMRGFHHREPGIAGFGLLKEDMYVEIIADPFHLHDRIIDMVFKMKHPGKIILISDSVRETAKDFGGAGIQDDSGRLLGGSMTITDSAKRLIQRGYDQEVIMRCITENPRAYLSW